MRHYTKITEEVPIAWPKIPTLNTVDLCTGRKTSSKMSLGANTARNQRCKRIKIKTEKNTPKMIGRQRSKTESVVIIYGEILKNIKKFNKTRL